MRVTLLPRSPRRQAGLACAASTLVHALLAGGVVAWGLWEAHWYLESHVTRGRPIVIAASFDSAAAHAAPQPTEVVLEPLPPDPTPVEKPPSEKPLEPQQPKLERTPTTAEPQPPSEQEPLVELEVEVSEVALARPQAPRETPPEESAAKPPPKQSSAPPQIASQAAQASSRPPEVGANVDELPRALASNLPPSYPADAVAQRREGRVIVRAQVGSDGHVAKVELDLTSGTPSLDAAALAAVATWRFLPARRAGAAIAYEVLVPVRFRLRQG